MKNNGSIINALAIDSNGVLYELYLNQKTMKFSMSALSLSASSAGQITIHARYIVLDSDHHDETTVMILDKQTGELSEYNLEA
jgi:hypothetical protein